EAHRRYGRLPWSDVLQPAITLAEEGFAVNHYVAMMIAANYDLLSRFPESRRTFIKPSGAPLSAVRGDRLRQPELARTLRLIAQDGPEVPYHGEIARLIAEDMARHGGLIDEADLARHRTRVFEPASVRYHDVEILGQLANSGYPTVAEALQIVEGLELNRYGFQSTEAIHLITESLRRALVDRLRYLGDPELAPVPLRGVVDPGYAAARRATIDLEHATPDAGPGDPWRFEPAPAPAPARSGTPGEGQTTHITVIDGERNMVALTSTLGGTFGSGVVIAGTGIVLNNAVTWFDPEPGAVTSIGPGKRVMSASSPVVLLRDGQPYAALGSPGGRRVMSAIYQIIVNLVEYGLGMQAAISAPRVHSEGPVTEISTRFPAEVLAGLEAMGHRLLPREDSLSSMHFARPNGIQIDPASGELHGGVFPFSPATAIGV
ncbi:MAG TPA: gamma-glutamyltransferase, partial [Thermomicrobiaceae bacterium]|nr:gamma-glutamyltransferase [Thermomicrobiaceae bacterium]